MSKPRIAVDLDGVLYDFGGTLRHLVKWHHGIEVPVATHWDAYQENVPEHVWDWVWSEGIDLGLFKYGHHIKGSIDGLREIAKYGDLEIVTHRPRAALQDTMRFIADLPDVFSGVHFLTNAEPKSLLGCDIYIDDAPHVAEDVLVSGKELVLFRQPWNSGWVAESPRSFYVAEGWDVLPQTLRSAIQWLDIKDAR